MNPYVIGAIGAVVGIAIGFFVERILKGAAYKSRDEVLREADREAESIKKNAELAAKEELLKRREELEKETQQLRDDLRTKETQVEKREAAFEVQVHDFEKRERMLEVTQKKLADRTKAVDAREAELDRIIREEQEQLFKISELDRDKAIEMLLDRLDRQLGNETGQLILKHRNKLKLECEKQAQEIAEREILSPPEAASDMASLLRHERRLAIRAMKPHEAFGRMIASNDLELWHAVFEGGREISGFTPELWERLEDQYRRMRWRDRFNGDADRMDPQDLLATGPSDEQRDEFAEKALHGTKRRQEAIQTGEQLLRFAIHLVKANDPDGNDSDALVTLASSLSAST